MKRSASSECLDPTSSRLQDLFSQWLQRSATKTLVRAFARPSQQIADLIGQVKSGYPLYVPPPPHSGGMSPITAPTVSSPVRHSPLNSSLEKSHSSSKLILHPSISKTLKEIPPFFVKAKMQEPWKDPQILSKIFRDNNGSLRLGFFRSLVKDLFHFPTFFSEALFDRICFLGTGRAPDPKQREQTSMSLEWALKFWENEIVPFDDNERAFRLIKQPSAAAIVPADLEAILEVLVENHEGLEFLKDSPEFQPKYIRTVVDRIFFILNRSLTRMITLKEFQSSNFLETCHAVDATEDVNSITDYFSYEHFYVIYCKFYELDEDHDMLLKRDDLMRYEEHSLTYRRPIPFASLLSPPSQKIVDRIMAGAGHPIMCKESGCFGYDDFVYFILSEEDKTTIPSLSYWFRCVDLDGNGEILAHEMEEFYSDQVTRMESLGYEVVPFVDVLCQLCDLLHSSDDRVSLKSLTNPQVIDRSGVFFDQLFNLTKFNNFENRDPFALRQQKLEGSTPWVRWASNEYYRLAMAEEEEDVMYTSDI